MVTLVYDFWILGIMVWDLEKIPTGHELNQVVK